MIFREFPTRLSITPFDEEGYEKDEQVEITVMFVTKKFRANSMGEQSEDMVAVGYDSDKNIHESILNQSKIIEVEDYGSKIRSSRDTRRKIYSSGEKTKVGNNNSPDEKADEADK